MRASCDYASLYGGLIGPLAIVSCEPRQARKGATVAVRLCAGVWLVRLPPSLFPLCKELPTTCQVARL
jgi:hypothetical protein